MEMTPQTRQNSYTLHIPPQGAGFSSASVLVVSLAEQSVKDYLARTVFEEEGYIYAPDQKTAGKSPYSYHYSTVSLFFTANSAFPTTRNTAINMEEACLYLHDEIAKMPNLRAIITLGIAAHHTFLQACHLPRSHLIYRPGQVRSLPDGLLIAHGEHIPASMLAHQVETSQRVHSLRKALIRLRNKLGIAPEAMSEAGLIKTRSLSG